MKCVVCRFGLENKVSPFFISDLSLYYRVRPFIPSTDLEVQGRRFKSGVGYNDGDYSVLEI